jgi:hypothetical protein
MARRSAAVTHSKYLSQLWESKTELERSAYKLYSMNRVGRIVTIPRG